MILLVILYIKVVYIKVEVLKNQYIERERNNIFKKIKIFLILGNRLFAYNYEHIFLNKKLYVFIRRISL